MVMHNRGDESSRRTVRKADAGSGHSESRELEGESDVSVHGHVESADVEAQGLKGSDGKSSKAKRDDDGSVTLPTATRRTGKTSGRSAQKAALASKSRVAKGKNTADEKHDYDEDSESWDGGGPNAVQATAITTDHLQSISEAHTSTADAHTHGPGDASSDADNESIGAEEAQKTGADEGGVIGSQSSSVAGDAHTAAVNDTERSPVETDVDNTEKPPQAVGVAVEEQATTEKGGASGSALADLNREKERTEVVATPGIEDSEPGENPEIPPIADESVAGDTPAKNGERESVGVDGNPEGADETTRAENDDDNDILVEATNDAIASSDTEGVGQEESSQPSPAVEAAKPAEDDTLPADGSEESAVAKEDSEENISSEDDVPEEPKANLMSREEEVWGGAGDPPRPAGEFESDTRSAKDGREPPHFDVNATSPTKFREHAN
ncbi:hypothetical protein Pmar_PMAR001479 [Perkinsus marinus ATCC 50983]|uniref:Uncharacterized protein n=1 Tax=Perkinsus marinus (strain ATCC 50983 / TXsc) TaxID=423536 RepID=C5LJB8_PERM5|nr:hypothetical protein Pmar_PMAR001479 [Perkinsus marinus ATCC 50983]EER03175.1 hypothetical protein Pmar_PMAR001479 [Perkinsus marinus ATCC 50983]|eukprot:XP_002771359.1 hypothetical protein Pmar_PMAR001479 [Perkinsus marinus ATCC 50983]